MLFKKTAIALMLMLGMSGCAVAPADDGVGVVPVLPEPRHQLIPTVDIAKATPWSLGEMPLVEPRFEVVEFAGGLAHPRWLYTLPNGDVLVAETNGPAGKRGIRGIKGAVMQRLMKSAGAGAPSADRIRLLRDADHDGVAEYQTIFAQGLHSPFGMALVGDQLYIANADALMAFHYETGALRLSGAPKLVSALPGGVGELNHHWTKSLLASRDGKHLYVGVGSNSNVGENGSAVERNRAAILEVDIATGESRIYADGLRNPVGLAWEPDGQALFAVVNERDELGNNLVPDYLTQVQRGGFYGWPYSYWGQHIDARVSPADPVRVARALVPDFALGNHVAPLGLVFAQPNTLGGKYGSGAFVALHGSWNRKPLNGYKVVFVPFQNGRPTGKPRDVLTGFLSERHEARGRPAGLALTRDGNLLVADDVGNRVWLVRARH